MNKVDRNEAPVGYKAKRACGKKNLQCSDCAFYHENGTGCSARYKCMSDTRQDGCGVIFIKKD